MFQTAVHQANTIKYLAYKHMQLEVYSQSVKLHCKMRKWIRLQSCYGKAI